MSRRAARFFVAFAIIVNGFACLHNLSRDAWGLALLNVVIIAMLLVFDRVIEGRIGPMSKMWHRSRNPVSLKNSLRDHRGQLFPPRQFWWRI